MLQIVKFRKMPQIVQIESRVLAAVTEPTTYIKARNKADELALEHSLTVADMPMLIQAMANHSEIREAIRPLWINTITGEYHGQRDGDRSYEVWHSVGSLAIAEGLEKAFSNAGEHVFMKITYDEWVAVGNGNYNGKDVARIHLEDVRKGNVPAAGTPYTIFTLLDKDKPNINGGNELIYDNFMSDDRVLMITGSPDNREALAKMLFGRKEDGGEGYSNFGSHHCINEVGFAAQANGRPVYLNYYNIGLDGFGYIHLGGRFVVLAPEAAVAREKLAAH